MSRSDRGDRERCPSAHTGADEGAIIERFRFSQGGFAAPAATYFAHGGKVGKTPPGTAPDEHFVLIVAYPTPSGPSGHLPLTGGVGPGPHYEGRPAGKSSRISGAQNLSGWSKFPPGHWALGLQKLPLVRFHLCAWLCRANAAGANLGGRPKGLPYPILKDFLEARRAGTCPHRR